MNVVRLLLLFSLAGLASAAPIPKNLESKSEAIKRLFGDVLVSDDISFDLHNTNVLSVSIAKGAAKRDMGWNGQFPKLVSKEVNGEFEASVKLTMAFDQNAKASGTDDKRSCCSGLLLTSANESTLSFLGYYHNHNKKDWQSGLFLLTKSSRGGSSMMSNLKYDEKPYSIRLTRREGKVNIETAADGKPYRLFTTTNFVPDDVKVSLVHFNTLDTTVTTEYEDFVVREAPAK